MVRGPLTDRKIEQYRKMGFYSNEWRTARKEFWKNRETRKRVHSNFVQAEDGRLIYSPT